MNKPPVPPRNSILKVPVDKARAVRGSFLVRPTNAYSLPKTESGIVIPEDSEADIVEKKYNIGEVVHAGPECIDIHQGDIVVYMRNAAWRVPNGIEAPALYKLEETPAAILCILPALTKEEQAENDRAFAEAHEADNKPFSPIEPDPPSARRRETKVYL